MIQFGIPHAPSPLPYLLSTQEFADNCVQFTIAPSYVEQTNDITSELRPILPDENHYYRITFEGYIFYMVRNESYSQDDEGYDIKRGSHFLIFDRSHLLDIVPTLTLCQKCADGSNFPGPWKHYGIRCQNHTIDIIARYEPIIESIG